MSDARYDTQRLDTPNPVSRTLRSVRDSRHEDAAIFYLALIAVAEFVTSFGSPVAGVTMHALLLGLLLTHASMLPVGASRAFFLSLTIAPIIRIVSLGMPIGTMDEQWQFLLAGLPLLGVALALTYAVGLTRDELHLRLPTWRWWPVTIVVACSGGLIGVAQYESSALRPSGLVGSLGLTDVILPALVIVFTTGVVEELLFRGILQTTAIRVLGQWAGIFLVSALFAVLHSGTGSSLFMLIAFGVGIYLSWITLRTGSLAGAILAHSVANILLFIVLPAI